MNAQRFCKLPHIVVSSTKLTFSAKCIYAVIADRVGRNHHSWPGFRRIAADVGTTSRGVVERSIKLLESEGFIKVEKTPKGLPNRYKLAQLADARSASLTGPKMGTDTGPKTGPVKKDHRPSFGTSTGPKTGPLPAPKQGHNQTQPDFFNQTLPIGSASSAKTATAKRPNLPSGFRELSDQFCAEWQKRHGHKYPFTGVKDGQAVKAILSGLEGDLDRAKAIVVRFLDDPDPWLKGKHTLGMLRTQLTRYLEDAKHGGAKPDRPDLGSDDRYREYMRKAGIA